VTAIGAPDHFAGGQHMEHLFLALLTNNQSIEGLIMLLLATSVADEGGFC
jgi:hypothetical protein